MNKRIFLSVFLLLLFPISVFAHETREYEINGVPYEIVVGSLNEPVIVDDKTGVSVELVRAGKFLVGAQDALKVEMISGDKSRTVDLSPVYGTEGQYKSNFIATVPTTLTYRVFGTLENTEVNLSFTCNPAGHPQSVEDKARTEISNGVVQTLKKGAFGCPQSKEEFGFPEAAQSSFEASKNIQELEAKTSVNTQTDSKPDSMSILTLVLALCGLGLGYLAYTRRK